MKLVYQAIVLYFTIHLLWALRREKKVWAQAGAAMVLVLFVLRLLMIQ